MGKILRSPISIDRVANFVDSMTRAFFTCNCHTLTTEICFWNPKDVYRPPGAIPVDEGVWDAYQTLFVGGRLDELAARSSEFAAANNAYRDSDFLIKNRVFSKTLLENLLRRQELHNSIKEYVIYSEKGVMNGLDFDKWISYRNAMIDEAQARINQYPGAF